MGDRDFMYGDIVAGSSTFAIRQSKTIVAAILRFFEIALVLVRLGHVAPELDGSLRRGRLTSSPLQFGQTKCICSAQLAQYVHS